MNEARYLGVAPWDLLDQPLIWRKWAAAAARAEAEARKQKKARSERRKGMMGS